MQTKKKNKKQKTRLLNSFLQRILKTLNFVFAFHWEEFKSKHMTAVVVN